MNLGDNVDIDLQFPNPNPNETDGDYCCRIFDDPDHDITDQSLLQLWVHLRTHFPEDTPPLMDNDLVEVMGGQGNFDILKEMLTNDLQNRGSRIFTYG